MENILITRGGRRLVTIAFPSPLALIATLAGRLVALPYSAAIDVLVDDGRTGFGRVRYVAADGTVAVHFGRDPHNHVWEFPADRIRPVRGALAIAAIRAHLATDPPVACDLDTASEPLRVERAA